jgi:RHS repeat-associated protein
MVKKTTPMDTWEFIWDPEHHLREVRKNNSLIAQYGYDPAGRRLWKEVNTVRTYFHYADEGLVGEYDRLGNEIRSYGYEPNSWWTHGPIFLKQGIHYYWYHHDSLGTPVKLTDSAGQTAWSALFDPFGRVWETAGFVENPLRFAGQYDDLETGLYYNWMRYYDPSLGRYISVDPLRSGVNFYVYAKNNPLAFIDPSGEIIPLLPVLGAMAAGAALDLLYQWICRHDIDYWEVLFSGLTAGAFRALGSIFNKFGGKFFGGKTPPRPPGAAKAEASLPQRILAADRAGSGLKADATHRGASFLTKEQLEAGTSFAIKGGDGVVRELLQTPGGMNGKTGIFEYILDPTKGVTHQRFIPGGKITGVPNQKVP